MPRLTVHDYLMAHRQLRAYWLEDRGLFSLLSPAQQWSLHRFFRPAEKLSIDQLKAHRRAVTAQHPSLPHQAGRALAKLRRLIDQQSQQVIQAPHPQQGRRHYAIEARGVVRPEIDVHKLARALLALAAEDIKAMQTASDDEPPAA